MQSGGVKMNLSGKSIGITGGAGYLGSSMVDLLLRKGATVLVVERDHTRFKTLKKNIVGASGNLLFLSGDAFSEETTNRAIEMLLQETGKIDGWVNNAYSAIANSNPMMQTRENLESTWESLTGVILTTQAVSERMIAGSRCAIVNISSMYGMVSPNPKVYDGHESLHNPAAYGAMKAALIQYTRYAAVHLATKDIRINSISPGPFPNTTTTKNVEFVAALEKQVPMQRIGSPEELAGVVAFLLSDYSTYMTGTNIVVDGGWTAW